MHARDNNTVAGLECLRLYPAQGPAVLLLHEIFGVTAAMRELAGLFAVLGYAVYVPALFHRQVCALALDYEQDEAHGRALLAGLDLPLLQQDLTQLAAALRTRHTRLGIVGFCLGGRLAYRLSTQGLADCAVAFYGGKIAADLANWGVNRCPLQLHYGSADALIGTAEVEQVASTLAGHASVYRYPGAGHGFFCHARRSHHPAATLAASQQLLPFLAAHLT